MNTPVNGGTRPLLDAAILPILEMFPTLDVTEENLSVWRQLAPLPEAVDLPVPAEVVHIPGENAGHSIELRIFSPPANGAARPAIYHMHGGGFVAGSAEMMDAINSARAADLGAVIVSVHYRLAPETHFPGPLEDCYAGLKWLAENAGRYSIDVNRIAVLGESAGGGLAAALSLLARDRNGPKIAAQFLIYPMLDYRTGGADDPYRNCNSGEFGWTRQNNQFGWAAMRGSAAIDSRTMPYFSPALADDLSTLPPCFMATAMLDLFMDENVEYARRLVHAGVLAETHVYAGTVHAFDLITDAPVSACFAADMRNALQRFLDL